ncbi:MAG: hypothetical protein AB9895_05670 [Negativicutes bacterium]
MMGQQWTLLDSWLVEGQRRAIFKNVGPNLIDITADEEIIDEIVSHVLISSWSTQEFMDYLKTQGLND